VGGDDHRAFLQKSADVLATHATRRAGYQDDFACQTHRVTSSETLLAEYAPGVVIGARIDGPDKVTGAATYAADLTRPGMLWGKVLRSPFPHARIVSIDTTKACALPGVRAVLTGADIPAEVRVGRNMRDMPVLARDKVRFVGEKVVAVAAESQALAERA